MSIKTSTVLNEEGDGTFRGEFRDKDGVLFTPDSLTYSLNDKDGNIINGLDGIAVLGFSTSYEINLSGDDLSIPEVTTAKIVPRYLLIVAGYGTKQETEECVFYLNNLVGIK